MEHIKVIIAQGILCKMTEGKCRGNWGVTQIDRLIVQLLFDVSDQCQAFSEQSCSLFYYFCVFVGLACFLQFWLFVRLLDRACCSSSVDPLSPQTAHIQVQVIVRHTCIMPVLVRMYPRWCDSSSCWISLTFYYLFGSIHPLCSL